MGIETQALCDLCGAAKKKTNHWFMAFAESAADETVARIVFTHFDEAMARNYNFVVLCGEECCHSFLSQALAEIVLPGSFSTSSCERNWNGRIFEWREPGDKTGTDFRADDTD